MEGGRTLIQSFIDEEFWDEARVEVAPVKLGAGVHAPKISMVYFEEESNQDGNKFILFKKNDN